MSHWIMQFNSTSASSTRSMDFQGGPCNVVELGVRVGRDGFPRDGFCAFTLKEGGFIVSA